MFFHIQLIIKTIQIITHRDIRTCRILSTENAARKSWRRWDNLLFRADGIMESESQIIIFPHSKHVGSQQTMAMIDLHNQFGNPAHAIDFLMRQATADKAL